MMFDNKTYIKFEYDHADDCILIESNLESGVDKKRSIEDMSSLLYQIHSGVLLEDSARAILSYGMQNDIDELTSRIIIRWKDRISFGKEKAPFVDPISVFDFRKGNGINA